jgi:hypothetical protein
MSALDFALLLLPLSAALAGFVLWITSRDETLGDTALVVRFTVLAAIATLVAWSVGRSEAVQLRINPALRAQRALESQPVYAAFQQHLPGELPALQKALLERAQRGEALDEAFHHIRPMLTRVVVDRLGFADHASRLAWGRQEVATLRALERVDAGACYAAMAAQPIDDRTLDRAFDATQEAQFQQAVVAVLEGGGRHPAGELAPGDKAVDFNALQDEYLVIRDELSSRLGPQAVAAISSKSFPAEPALPAGEVCEARIAQLEAILERPRDMAAMLVDAVLR